MAKGLPKKYIKQYGISKKAWREYRKAKGKGKRKASKKRKNNPRKGNRRMARKFTIPVALIGGVAGMQGTQRVVNALSKGDVNGVMKALPNFVGVDAGKFYPNLLMRNLTPLGIGVAIHMVARKLGVNRMLGQAGVPVLRI